MVKKSIDILQEAEEILQKNDLAERHSFFQLKCFNIHKEPNTQGKLWQCLREMTVRSKNIRALELEIEETNDNIELLKIHLEMIHIKCKEISEENIELKNLKYREKQININKIRRKIYSTEESLKELKNRIKYQQEELKFFIQEFNSLEKIEKVKSIDDINAQKEYWENKLYQDVKLRSLLGYPIDIELAKCILSITDDSKLKNNFIKQLENVQNKITHQITCEGVDGR